MNDFLNNNIMQEKMEIDWKKRKISLVIKEI